ncbi:MAG: sigma-70 family RNA polymerase sigma factor [Planctomycetota bacterium]
MILPNNAEKTPHWSEENTATCPVPASLWKRWHGEVRKNQPTDAGQWSQVHQLELEACQLIRESEDVPNVPAKGSTLTVEEERWLFRLFVDSKRCLSEMAERTAETSATREPFDNELIAEMESAVLQQRNRLIECNVGLVHLVCGKMAKQTQLDQEDLFGVGVMGLMKAVDRFDAQRGTKFSSYAYTAIQRAIISASQREYRKKSRWNGDVESIELQDEAASSVVQTDREELQLRTIISEMLEELPAKDQTIISCRLGFEAMESKATFEAISRELGISKERVRQRYLNAVAKLGRIAKQSRWSTKLELFEARLQLGEVA